MQIINLKQNSQEWYEFRRSGIGASDAPIIMGVSPYRTMYQLYLDKTESMVQEQNESMRRGRDLEPVAREAFEKLYLGMYGCEISANPCVVQSDENKFIFASLDGYDQEKKVMVEIKCPGEKDHAMAKDTKAVPDKYYPQLQHQMYVTGLESMFYFSYRNSEDFFSIKCLRDNKFIEKLVAAEIKFYKAIQSRTPPELADTDYEERFDMDFLEVSMLYEDVKKNLEKAEAQEKELKEKLIGLCNGKNSRAGRVRIGFHTRKGIVDYSKIDQFKGVDLDKYRKPDTKYSSIRLSN